MKSGSCHTPKADKAEFILILRFPEVCTAPTPLLCPDAGYRTTCLRVAVGLCFISFQLKFKNVDMAMPKSTGSDCRSTEERITSR
jgi:hypothetical protein